MTPFNKFEVTPSAWLVRAFRGIVSGTYQATHVQVGWSCPIISPLRNMYNRVMTAFATRTSKKNRERCYVTQW